MCPTSCGAVFCLINTLADGAEVCTLVLSSYFTAGVHLSLRNKLIPNNSYVVMDDIGSTDDTALLCHTNEPSLHAFWGNWFDPNGNKVSGDSAWRCSRTWEK